MSTLELPSIDEIDRCLAERSLADYTRQMWPILEPGTEYLHNWHIDCMCEHLEAVTLGQITRLIVNVPPRHMKSTAVSIAWPTWEWIQHPDYRYIFGSYSQSLSTKHSVDRRTVIQSDWYRRNWGDRFRLTGDQNVKTEFRNDQQGVMFATSLAGTVMGKGGRRIIVDDPHNPKEAESSLQREAGITAFDRTLSTRLDDKKNGAIVVVMQRLHEKDLSGHLMKQGGYVHLCLEAEADQHTTISLPSGKTIERKPGDLLWPEREGPKEIESAKRALGPYGYAGQYQQAPAPAGGGRFKSDWFRSFDVMDGKYRLLQPDGSFKAVAIGECDRFAMMDPAGTEADQNNRPCYTVIGIIDVTPTHDMVIVDLYRGQVEAPAAADKGVELTRRYDLPWIGVEKDGIGLGVVQSIRRRGVTVRPIKARGSKEARSETAEIRMAAGMIYWPANAPWRFDFEAELLNFPTGEYKDQVDMLAHAAIWVQKSHGAPQGSDAMNESAADETPDRPDVVDFDQARREAEDAFVAWGDD